MPTKSIAQKIKATRLAAGWSQEECAKRAGIPQSHWSALELDKKQPMIRTLRKVARALKVPVATLLE